MARGSIVWWNGELLPVENAKVSLFTHGLHYGTGVFEGIRAYKQTKGGGAVFRLREHMERFQNSFKIMGFPIPFSVDDLMKAAVSVAKKNNFQECYLRPVGFIGDGPLGVYPGDKPPIDIAILSWEWGSYLGDDGMTRGARLMTSTYNRPHPNSIMTKAKIAGHYVTGVMAKREAKANGFDEALFLDPEGFLAEGTGENIFIVKEGVIRTTPPNSILNGITRQTVIAHLRAKGHTVLEQRFTRDDLYIADEVFLTGTAAEITPVAEIDRRQIGKTGSPGALTTELQKEYQKIVRGELPPYGKSWLTPIQ